MSKKNFLEILEEVKTTRKPIKTYPSVALKHLGVSRRGIRVNETINELLDSYEVYSSPDFGNVWFYDPIEIIPKPKVKAGNEDYEIDPVPRISKLKAANLDREFEEEKGKGLISVTRDTTIQEAITLMILNDFSQLPIFSHPKGEVDGMISWKSIGRNLGLGKTCVTVNDCKEDIAILKYDTPLFEAVKDVLDKEVVLVRKKDKTISGIITTTDIGEEFISLAEPFLFIEQIENHLRRLLHEKFSPDEIQFNSNYEEKVKEIKKLSDMTFGQYVRILEHPDRFHKLGLNIDRSLFVKQLEEVRLIRNDIMHFDIANKNDIRHIEVLKQTLNFMNTLAAAIKQKK
ncbi:CBS domain-containing protein [Flavobacterium sp. C4GT6]|uniref:CBS domain-containing protein n=1 Tax=Flavobacterium sp. C4GT6 TaxID=3103818 RepID=UPI002ED30D3A